MVPSMGLVRPCCRHRTRLSWVGLIRSLSATGVAHHKNAATSLGPELMASSRSRNERHAGYPSRSWCRHRCRHPQARPHRGGGRLDRPGPGTPDGWAIEGTGRFGAGLTTAAAPLGQRIVEVGRPPPARSSWRGEERRHRRRASGCAGARRGRPQRAAEPRGREAIRVLLTTRAQAVKFRTRAISSALHDLDTSAPDGFRERLRTLPLGQLLAYLRRAA